MENTEYYNTEFYMGTQYQLEKQDIFALGQYSVLLKTEAPGILKQISVEEFKFPFLKELGLEVSNLQETLILDNDEDEFWDHYESTFSFDVEKLVPIKFDLTKFDELGQAFTSFGREIPIDSLGIKGKTFLLMSECIDFEYELTGSSLDDDVLAKEIVDSIESSVSAAEKLYESGFKFEHSMFDVHFGQFVRKDGELKCIDLICEL